MANDGLSPHSPSLHLAWPYRPSAIETTPRQVPVGPLITWPKNASCSRILPRASRASLPLRRWATTCCRLLLRPCPAPLSFSLQLLLKLSLLSAGPSLLKFVSIISLLLKSRKSDFWTCVFVLPWPLLPLLSDRNELQLFKSPCLQFGRYHHSDSTITFISL